MSSLGAPDKPIKTAYARVGIWYNEATGHIHMSVPDTDYFVTTVNDVDGSKRCHRNLYKKLAQFLEDQGVPGPLTHPTPAEGGDTLDAPTESP